MKMFSSWFGGDNGGPDDKENSAIPSTSSSSPIPSSSSSPIPSTSSSAPRKVRPQLPSTKDALSRFNMYDFLPSSEVLYFTTAGTVFFGGAVFGAKQFLKYEDKSTNLRQTIQNSRQPAQLAFRALMYGTALSIGTFGLGIMCYCGVTGIRNANDLGRHMVCSCVFSI